MLAPFQPARPQAAIATSVTITTTVCPDPSNSHVTRVSTRATAHRDRDYTCDCRRAARPVVSTRAIAASDRVDRAVLGGVHGPRVSTRTTADSDRDVERLWRGRIAKPWTAFATCKHHGRLQPISQFQPSRPLTAITVPACVTKNRFGPRFQPARPPIAIANNGAV